MSRRSTLLTLMLCFGVGVGLAPRVQVAHACKCDLAGESYALRLVELSGSVDDEVLLAEQQAAWPSETDLTATSASTLRFAFDVEHAMTMEVAP